MLEHFFADRSDPSKPQLAQKLKDTLDAHFDGPLSLEELLHLLHAESCIVQESFEELPEGEAGEHLCEGLRRYLEALFLVGRELEATGELSRETETRAYALTAEADQAFGGFPIQALPDQSAEVEF